MNDITKEYHLIKSQIHYKENNSVKVRKVTKVHKVLNELQKMEVNDEISKKELILKYWDSDNFWNTRSADVAFNNAKKLLPEMKFRTAKGLITRIS